MGIKLDIRLDFDNNNRPIGSQILGVSAGYLDSKMHLKIDTKQKIKYIRAFISELRTSQATSKYITINPNECGFFDYDYITKRRKTIGDIDKDLKENKYQYVKEVCNDIKILYENVKEYLLLEDHLQEELDRYISLLADFQLRFSQDFKQNRLIKDPKMPKKQDGRQSNKQDINKDNREKQSTLVSANPGAKPEKQEPVIPPQPLIEFNRRSSFGEKLEMFFYLRSHEDNMEYVKSIGESYGIGKQDKDADGDYAIRLDANASTCLWLELLQKKDQ